MKKSVFFVSNIYEKTFRPERHYFSNFAQIDITNSEALFACFIIYFYKSFVFEQLLNTEKDTEETARRKRDKLHLSLSVLLAFFICLVEILNNKSVIDAIYRLLHIRPPAGRSAEQQQTFEQVEIVPQTIRCLLTLMCADAFACHRIICLLILTPVPVPLLKMLKCKHRHFG